MLRARQPLRIHSARCVARTAIKEEKETETTDFTDYTDYKKHVAAESVELLKDSAFFHLWVLGVLCGKTGSLEIKILKKSRTGAWYGV